jgi:hypothetical protein
MMWQGEHAAWDILSVMDSKDIEARAFAVFDPDKSTYKLSCLGQEISVSLMNRSIIWSSALGRFLIEDLEEYSRLSILRYLITAKVLPFSERLVKPSDLPGGDFFSRGTHILPLNKIIGKFEKDFNGFIKTGMTLGGVRAEYGDVSLRLLPFPRIPVYIIIWESDDEFSAKSSLLFDSSCISHASIDILWATAMMTLEMMVKL